MERPKEFGCENGRGMDLIRWGFFYDNGRLDQLKEHGTFYKDKTIDVKTPVTYAQTKTDPEHVKSSYDTYLPGHEFLPIFQTLLNNNPNLRVILRMMVLTTQPISSEEVGPFIL